VAVAPDGSWLAVGSADGTVRIWDVAARHIEALIRVEGSVNAAAWVGSSALAVGGSAGLYIFDFLTDTTKPTAKH
jgi:WD40 repeat protein